MLKRTTLPVGCGWDYIVLFTGPRKGFVVHIFARGPQGEDRRIPNPDIGMYYESWGEHSFSPYNGTVQLSN